MKRALPVLLFLVGVAGGCPAPTVMTEYEYDGITFAAGGKIVAANPGGGGNPHPRLQIEIRTRFLEVSPWVLNRVGLECWMGTERCPASTVQDASGTTWPVPIFVTAGGGGGGGVTADVITGGGGGRRTGLDLDLGLVIPPLSFNGPPTFLSTVASDLQLDLFLKAVEDRRHTTHLLTEPRVATANRPEPVLTIDRNTPFVALTFEVKPEVDSGESHVRINLIPVMVPTDPVAYEAARKPVIENRTFTETFTLEENQTVSVVGLLEEERPLAKKIPILGDVPYLGMLFSRHERENTKTDIVVFATPMILDSPEE